MSYHIIHDGSNGNYDDSVVNQQMQVLNTAFAGSGFSFTLREIERTNNAAWFQNCGAAEDGMGGNEMQMKTALRKAGDNLDVLYIYTCIPGEDAGYATFPDDGLTLVEDGIVILYTTLPGGTAEGQNEGTYDCRNGRKVKLKSCLAFLNGPFCRSIEQATLLRMKLVSGLKQRK